MLLGIIIIMVPEWNERFMEEIKMAMKFKMATKEYLCHLIQFLGIFNYSLFELNFLFFVEINEI